MPTGDVFEIAGAKARMELLFKRLAWNVASVAVKDMGTKTVPSARDSVPPEAFVIEEEVSRITEAEPRHPVVVNVLSVPVASFDAASFERTL